MRLLILLLLLCPALRGADFGKEPMDRDEDDIERSYLARQEEKAAKYRLLRAAAQPDSTADQEAAEYLSRARRYLEQGHPRRAYRTAIKGFDRHPYSSHAAELQHLKVAAYAKKGKVAHAREALMQLWLYFPDYPEIGAAMATALEAAEKQQSFSTRIDLNAEKPSAVISLSGTGFIEENNRLFRFLSEHGDRETVGPRASLGLARALMLGTSRKEFHPVHEAYEKFLDSYPDHELTFTALCELALSHLATYRGNKFDIGALTQAASIIDQADLESRGNLERTKLVAAYRARIRSWLQDRDLQVARWYRDRKHPIGLAWLREPSYSDWDDAARTYYRAVIARDSTSKYGRAAQAELAKLPPPKLRQHGEDLLDRQAAK
jgi:hypothetical protein